MIAGHDRLVVPRAVHDKREHAVQIRQAVHATVVAGAPQHLGVRLRLERMSAVVQLGLELDRVVEIAVAGHHHAVAAHRKLPVFHVDDRQPPTMESAAIMDLDPLAVWAPVRERVVHPLRGLSVDSLTEPRDQCHESADGPRCSQALVSAPNVCLFFI